MSDGRLAQLGPVDFPTLGWQLVDWIETFIRHGPGPVIGERWLERDDPRRAAFGLEDPELPGLGLDDREVRHLCWVYRVFPELGDVADMFEITDDEPNPRAGRRVFHRAIHVGPKGTRKSEIAGLVALMEGLAPVRFDHWAEPGEISWWGYRYEPGEPVGRPVTYPKVGCYATEENQAGNTYDNVWEMAGGAELLEAYPGVARGLGQTDLPSGGWIKPNTSGDSSQEGGGQTATVFDETFLWIQRKLKDQHRRVTRNIGKTAKLNDGFSYETSNAHFVGEGSVLEDAYVEAVKDPTIEGMIRRGVLIDWPEPAKRLTDAEFKSDKAVLNALRQLYGPKADWMDLEAILRDIRSPEATEDDSRRAWLNESRSTGSAWLDNALVRALILDPDRDRGTVGRDKPFTVRPGIPVAVGFDGSRFNDSTAIICVTERGVIFPWRVWQKTIHDGPDWEVPEEEVEAAVDELFELHPVARFYGDPWKWENNLAHMARRNGAAVKAWHTNREREAAFAVNEFEVAIRARAPRFYTGTSYGEVILDHIANTHTVKVTAILDDQGTRGHKLAKERKGSPKKIDCSIATWLAWKARIDAIAKDEFRTARRRRRRRGMGMFPLSK